MTMTATTPKIFRIIVEVADLEEATTFYAELLGVPADVIFSPGFEASPFGPFAISATAGEPVAPATPAGRSRPTAAPTCRARWCAPTAR